VRTSRHAVGAAILIVGGLTLGLTPRPTSAHNEVCSDGIGYRWTGTRVSQNIGGVDTVYRNAINAAQSNFNWSDFKYASSTTSGTIRWSNLNNPDTTIAGATSSTIDCATHRITGASMYFNYPHFTASAHDDWARQCTAIHELGHGVGLAHNGLLSTSGTSIMYGVHQDRCHSYSIVALQPHDTSDINAKY
jgi:hypothetical protein